MPNRMSDNLYSGSLKKKTKPTNVVARNLQDLLDPAIVSRALLAPRGRDKQGVGQWAVPGIVAGAMKALDQTGEAMRLPPGTSPNHPAYKGVFDVAGAINMPALLRKGATSTLGMNLWHGGPNKWAAEPGFPQGRPRLDKMGEGEGNAAFGEGFYSAQNPYVAKDYQRRLSPKPAQITYDGKPVSASSNRSGATRRGTDVTIQEGMANELYDLAKMQDLDPSVQKNLVDILQREKNKVATQKYDALVRAEAEGMSDSRRIPLVQQYDDHLAMLNSIDPKLIRKAGPDDVVSGPQGQLYKIDVPDEDIANYLDWDAPLSEQTDALAKIKQHWSDTIGDPDIIMDRLGISEASTGKELYQALGGIMQRQQAASETLGKAGIPGNKVAEVMSHPSKAQTHTYVTWDQKVLDRAKVLQRNEEIYKQLEKSGVPFA